MTQFALFKTTHPIPNLIELEESKNVFLSSAAKSLFPTCIHTNIYQMSWNGQDMDHLMVEAQRDIADGFSFEDTQIYKLIERLSETVEAIAFWYGSDYQDIEKTNKLEDVFTKIKSELHDSQCEVYLLYERSA